MKGGRDVESPSSLVCRKICPVPPLGQRTGGRVSTDVTGTRRNRDELPVDNSDKRVDSVLRIVTNHWVSPKDSDKWEEVSVQSPPREVRSLPPSSRVGTRIRPSTGPPRRSTRSGWEREHRKFLHQDSLLPRVDLPLRAYSVVTSGVAQEMSSRRLVPTHQTSFTRSFETSKRVEISLVLSLRPLNLLKPRLGLPGGRIPTPRLRFRTRSSTR